MDEAGREALRVGFEGTIKLEFHGAKVSSDAVIRTSTVRGFPVAALLLLHLLLSTQVMASTSGESDEAISSTVVEKVVVIGRSPGAPLWKVRKDRHVLWIFGTPELIPRDLEWRSDEIDHAIALSQEFLLPPSAEIRYSSPLGALRAKRLISHWNENPNSETLQDVLPADLYRLFSTAKNRYAPKKDGLEDLRPSRAADKLFDIAAESADLTSDRKIREALKKQAKRNGARVVWSSAYSKLKRVKPQLETMGSFSDEAELACLKAKLDGLEAQLREMTANARAWADGDIDPLREQHSRPGPGAACAMTALMQEELPPEIQELQVRASDLWLESVDRALVNNESTFAVLPLRELLNDEGLLARLREKGYVVEEPSKVASPGKGTESP